MSERTIRDCDGCGAVNVPGNRIHIPVARQHDSASARSEVRDDVVDLCPTCRSRLLEAILQRIAIEPKDGAALRSQIATWKPKFPDSGRP